MGCMVNKNAGVAASDSDNDFDATSRSKIILSKYSPRRRKYRWGSTLRRINEVNSHLEQPPSLDSSNT